MQIETLDHVALWVEDTDALATFLTSHLGMHVIERNERFTLVGSDARRGKLRCSRRAGRGIPACSVESGSASVTSMRRYERFPVTST